MSNLAQRVRVQNAILTMLKSGPYYEVAYAPSTGLAEDIDTGIAPTITPASARTNEVGSSFEVDQRYRRSYSLSRPQWDWIGIVAFDREVTAFQAEEDWRLSPPILPKTGDLEQVTIEVTGSNYSHPTQQQGHSGTVIEFQFLARLHRR